jgi:hypothetical protein
MTQENYNSEILVEDLLLAEEFTCRPVRDRSRDEQLKAMQRLTDVLVDDPKRLLQEVVKAAREVCHADSAGISMEAINLGGTPVFQWVALAGAYESFQGAIVPRDFLPCVLCQRSQRPQRVQVPSEHIREVMKIDAAPVTDGMVIPWNAEGHGATLWVVAHERTAAFDMDDYRILQVFANFAAMSYRSIQRQRRKLLDAVRRSSESTSNLLADGITNPLQGVTNCLFLAENGGPEAAFYTKEASVQLQRLSEIVKDLFPVAI